ncbi:hypothetical protein [Nocardia altamirensis]|uniref:hypothetical protein n=1 Tax=Nocardia altamirensis TaxID=472158 RepID=UPI00084002BE|nr:hypothetical protein [Nocardia altamirensis]
MPNQPKTQHRSVRVDEDRWTRFETATMDNGTDRAKALNAFMAWYLREPGAKLPQRPGPSPDLPSSGPTTE